MVAYYLRATSFKSKQKEKIIKWKERPSIIFQTIKIFGINIEPIKQQDVVNAPIGTGICLQDDGQMLYKP